MRSLLVAGVLVLSVQAASAGPYVGLAIGTGPATTGDVSFTEDGRSGRLFGGYAFGKVAVEAMATRYGLVREGGRIYDGTQLALAGRYNLPISDGFEAFGRAGLARTDLTSTLANDSAADAAGSGILLGGGVEYKISLKFVASAAVFVDYTLVTATLNGASDSDEGISTRHFSLGATVGF